MSANSVAFDLSDAQGELSDALSMAHDVVDHLGCAESCETSADFVTNLREAEAACRALLKEIRDNLKAMTP